jgi:hypothetical protein
LIATVDSGVLEGIARDVLETTCLDEPPVDAFELAECCGLEVRWSTSAPGARLSGRVVYVDERVRRERQHGLVAHEVAHFALDRARERNTERAARYLGGALLLPRTPFERHLRETKWNLVELHERHPNASYEMIGRRIVSLRNAVCVIVDNGRVTSRTDRSGWCEPYLGRRGWELVAEVVVSGKPSNPANLVWAVPVIDEGSGWQRVVLVAERARES